MASSVVVSVVMFFHNVVLNKKERGLFLSVPPMVVVVFGDHEHAHDPTF